MGTFVQTGLFAVSPIPARSLGLEANRTSSKRARLGFLYFLFMCVVLWFPCFPTSSSCRVAFHGEVEFPYLALDFSSPLRGWTGRTSVLDLPASHQLLLPSVADLLLWALEKQNPFLEEDGRTEADKGKPARTRSWDQTYKEYPRWVSLCSGHCKSGFLAFAYALPAQLLAEWE